MVFHWGLSDSKSPQVSRTHLSILAVFNNAVVWMVSTRPPTYKSSFFDSLAKSRYLSFFSLSSIFILWSAGAAKSTIL